jgi:hypothetical protein
MGLHLGFYTLVDTTQILPLFHNWWLLLQNIDNLTGTPFLIDIDNLISTQKFFIKKKPPTWKLWKK